MGQLEMVKRRHNNVIVHAINREGTGYYKVLVQLRKQYVEYTGTPLAIRAASKLMVNKPEFLDRKYAPLYCTMDGEYVKTAEFLERVRRERTEDGYYRGLIYD